MFVVFDYLYLPWVWDREEMTLWLRFAIIILQIHLLLKYK